MGSALMKKRIEPDDISRIVMLTYGKMDHGGPYWCYVAVRPSLYPEFSQAMDSKTYNMQNFAKDGYGEVIVSGEGVMPPKEITKKVAEMFKISPKDLFADIEHNKKIDEIVEGANDRVF
jgi:hypothetical protein